jgi:hypothetical protein
MDAPETEWVELFNGQDLSGWTPKITGYPLGEDPLGTFRVEDGLLTVGYENYDEFAGRFGHLFYEEPFTHYQLRVEYRFVGDQLPDAPRWAFKNSGVMFHSQAPETMLVGQSFPLSWRPSSWAAAESRTVPRPTSAHRAPTSISTGFGPTLTACPHARPPSMARSG